MAKSRRRTWTWHYDVSPEKLWPALADTARFNEAQAFPKHTVEATEQPDGLVIYTAKAKFGPFTLTWRDVPQEWVTNRFFRHARLPHNGPIAALVAEMYLHPEGNGTRIEFVLDVTPRNLLGVLILPFFFNGATKTLNRLIGEAAKFAAGQSAEPFVIPVPKLPQAAQERLRAKGQELEREGVAPRLVSRLTQYIAEAPEVDLFRIRPLKLARKWREPERDVVELCLRASRAGLLTMRWDVLCPSCRGGSTTAPSLDQLPRGAHCTSCNVDYDRDFDRNVELVFRPAEAIRPIPEGEFCLFGPMNVPHVMVQQTLAPGEAREVPAALAYGDYRVRPLNGLAEAKLAWTTGGFPEVISEGGSIRLGPPAPGGQLRVANRESREQTLVIESRAWLQDALTAHHATTMQSFRDLFATEVLRPGDDAAIGLVTLMFTDLKGSTALYGRIGDAAAYRLVRDHFALLARTVREHDGAIVKTIGDAVMAAFSDPGQALAAALAVQRSVMDFNHEHEAAHEEIVIKIGLHAGPCIAVNLNGRLDYFGTTVNLAARLQLQSQGGDIVLSASLAEDPAVAGKLEFLNALPETARVKGFETPVAFLRLSQVCSLPEAPPRSSAVGV